MVFAFISQPLTKKQVVSVDNEQLTAPKSKFFKKTASVFDLYRDARYSLLIASVAFCAHSWLLFTNVEPKLVRFAHNWNVGILE